MPEQHAFLSASGAHRWLNCPPSAQFEAHLSTGKETTEYAEEGTAAHRLAELQLLDMTGQINAPDYDRAVEEFKTQYEKYYNKAMQDYIDEYCATVMERFEATVNEQGKSVMIALESRLDFSEWVPEGYGTGDVLIVSPKRIEVIDLKYGAGVPVSAVDNPQLKLYALGAYAAYKLVYDFESVATTIIQPRLDSTSSAEYTVDELLRWGNDYVRPRAKLAMEGKGEQKAGEHCRFCKAKTICYARGRANMDFANKYHDKPRNRLSDKDIADILAGADELQKWLKDITEYALQEAENGKKWPGFKLVEGRSNRVYSDTDAVAARLTERGYPEAIIYERNLLPLSRLEKAIGKKVVEEALSDLLVKPAGKPTLVPESDKRPELNTAASAAADFAEEFKE